MTFFGSFPRADDCGSSVVSFLMGLPLLLLFLFAVVDLGRTAFLYAGAQDGAHAACQAAAQAQDGVVSGEVLCAAAVRACPALSSPDLRIAAAPRYGDLETATYAHRVYNSDTGRFEEVPAHVSRKKVEVVLTVRGGYLTPLGNLMAAAAGSGDGTFSFEARSARAVDATVEGGLR